MIGYSSLIKKVGLFKLLLGRSIQTVCFCLLYVVVAAVCCSLMMYACLWREFTRVHIGETLLLKD